MQEEYKNLDFKCGLEIHQQLDTHKLFCNCPSLLRSDEPDYIVMRKLHAVAGESGKIDVAAKYQSKLNNTYFYQGYKDTNCLIELDEEPPHEINKEALKIVLQISILLNAKILPITQIMRKTVIDGSNTSGFQRTVMVARDGYVETSEGRVKIEGIFLEEDAARIIKKEENKVTYRLDRLGIPLIEISTAPDIKSPEQAKETALIIGDVLRSCKVKRGIGTIRQDINMSIKGKNRIEIKGMQDMKVFLGVIKKEIKRQKELISKGEDIQKEVRNALPDETTEFLRPLPGSARMYPETDLPVLRISRDFINNAKKTLPKLRSEKEKELIKKGLNKDMVRLLFKQDKLGEFKELLEVINKPQLVFKVLLMYPKEVAKRQEISLEKTNEILNKDVLVFVLESIKKKKILETDIKQVFERILQGQDVREAIKFEKINEAEIEDKIRKTIQKKPGLSLNAYMGIVMKELKGKINGKTAMEIIKKYAK